MLKEDLERMVNLSADIWKHLGELQKTVHDKTGTGEAVKSWFDWNEDDDDDSDTQELIEILDGVSNSLNLFFSKCQTIQGKVEKRQDEYD